MGSDKEEADAAIAGGAGFEGGTGFVGVSGFKGGACVDGVGTGVGAGAGEEIDGRLSLTQPGITMSS